MPLEQNRSISEILNEEFLIPTEASQQDDDTIVMAIDTKENTTFIQLLEKYSEIYGGEGTEVNNFEIPTEHGKIDDHDFRTTTEISSSYLTPASQPQNDKETFQSYGTDEQLLQHMTDQGSGDMEFTTLPKDEIPHHETIKNLETIDVLENIVFDLDNGDKHEVTTTIPEIIDMVVDPIDVLPKNQRHRHQIRSKANEPQINDNDKFVGFQPTEDLVAPGEETTEIDRFLMSGEELELEKENKRQETFAEIVLETLKIVGEFGRDLKVNDSGLASTAGRSSLATDSTTLRSLYETFEEVVTTISDGIKLTQDARHTVNSFRDYDKKNI